MERLLNTLRPADVAAYLTSKGWRRGTSFREDRASLWLAPGGRSTDVLLPTRPTLADFTMRMGELVSNVAAVEGRSVAEVVRDVTAANADVMRVRIIASKGQGLTLPLVDGVNLLKKIRDVLIAAALATIEKRPFFTNRRPETIVEFLDALQLGQTEYSSFVFTVVSPLGEPGPDAQSHARGAEPPLAPFGRRVMLTLMHALDAMEKAALASARAGNVSAFLQTVADGVSGNLCDAVVELKSICPNNPIEFSVTWASAHRLPEQPIDAILLRQDDVAYIDAASDAFWGMPKTYDFRLEGMVRELGAPGDPQSRSAILMGYVDRKPCDVKVTFDAAVFPEVVRSFHDRLMICCEGDLVREGGSFLLKNPRYFRILEAAGSR